MLLKQIFFHRRLPKLLGRLRGLILAGLLLFPGGCGVKAPPVAPDVKTAVVTGLAQSVNGNELTLVWRMTDENPPPDFYTVYQSKTATTEKPCEGCPLTFERLLKVSAAGTGGSSTQTLTLDRGYHYGFKVSATTENGLEGPLSKKVTFTYE